jgi:hypothetical protein
VGGWIAIICADSILNAFYNERKEQHEYVGYAFKNLRSIGSVGPEK